MYNRKWLSECQRFRRPAYTRNACCLQDKHLVLDDAAVEAQAQEEAQDDHETDPQEEAQDDPVEAREEAQDDPVEAQEEARAPY